MMDYYFVKRGMPMVPAGTVELFERRRALELIDSGALTAFDPEDKRQAKAPGADRALAMLLARKAQ